MRLPQTYPQTYPNQRVFNKGDLCYVIQCHIGTTRPYVVVKTTISAVDDWFILSKHHKYNGKFLPRHTYSIYYWPVMKPWKRQFKTRFADWKRHNYQPFSAGHALSLNEDLFKNKRAAMAALAYEIAYYNARNF